MSILLVLAAGDQYILQRLSQHPHGYCELYWSVMEHNEMFYQTEKTGMKQSLVKFLSGKDSELPRDISMKL